MSIGRIVKSRIKFGKYKGRLISDIQIIDPNYLKWYLTVAR